MNENRKRMNVFAAPSALHLLGCETLIDEAEREVFSLKKNVRPVPCLSGAFSSVDALVVACVDVGCCCDLHSSLGEAMVRRKRIAVVGLGIYGSSVLRELAVATGNNCGDVDVVGFDALQPPHAYGSSHGGTRMLRIATFESVHYIDTALRTIEILEELQRNSAVAAHLATTFPRRPVAATSENAAKDVAPLYERNGVLFFGPTRDILETTHGVINPVKETVAVARAYNRTHATSRTIDFEVLSGTQLLERFPMFKLNDGADEKGAPIETKESIFGYYERSAGTMFPERCVSAMLFDAQRRGARVHTGCKVVGIVAGNDAYGTYDLITDGAHACCARDVRGFDHVVVCAGPWIHHLVPATHSSHFRLERHIFGWYDLKSDAKQSFSMEAGAPNFARFSVRSDARNKLYAAQKREPRTYDFFYGFPACIADGEVVKIAREEPGGDVEAGTMGDHALLQSEPYGSESESPKSYRHVPDREVAEMYDAVSPLLTGLSGRTVRKAACMYVSTPDYKLLVDRLPESAYRRGASAASNVTVVSACSGHGFKHAPAVAEGIARTLLRRLASTADVHAASAWPPRFPFESDAPRRDMYSWPAPAVAKL
jgi:sarcosine oxidase